jgi:hypothetical protein
MAMTIRMTKRTAEPVEEVSPAAEPQTSPGFVLSAYSAPVKTESFAIAAIAGLVACIFFVALVLLQWLEISYYKQPPSAFPLSGAGIVVSAEVPSPAAASPAAPVAPAGS